MIKKILALTLGFLLINTNYAAQAWTCSSYLINKDGYVATAGHCVRNAANFTIVYKHQAHTAQLVAVDYDKDVAVLKTDILGESGYSLTTTTVMNDTVYILGYPIPEIRGYNLKIASGFIRDTDRIYFRLEAGACGGNSGGPVVNKWNQVIGTLVIGYGLAECSAFSGATRTEYLITLLVQNNIQFSIEPDSEPRTDQITEHDLNNTLFLFVEGQ